MATKTRTRPTLTDAQLAIPGGFVCSGRLKCEADSAAIRQAVPRERPVRKLYTRSSGPIFVLKLKWQPGSFARKMVAEMWLEQQTKTRTALEFFSAELA